MGKKIWLSMHPRDFGSEKIVPTNVSTSTPSCAFEAPTSLGDKSHGHPDFKREQKKNNNNNNNNNNNRDESFFRVNFIVFINVDNRTGARARDKKHERPIPSKNMKIL